MPFKFNPFTNKLDIVDTIGGPGGQLVSLTGTTGGPVFGNGAGNITLNGSNLLDITGTPGTNSFSFTPTSAGYPITPYVVGVVGQAGYQTIQSALDAANSAGGGTVYIQASTSPYTENLMCYDGTGIVGVPGDSDVTLAANTVTIIGTHTPPLSGYFSIKNCYLQSANAIFFSAGSGSSILTISNSVIAVANGYTWDLDGWGTGGQFLGFNNQDFSGNNGVINNTSQATVYLQDSVMGSGSGFTMLTSGPITLKNIDLFTAWEMRKNTITNIDNCRFGGTVNATINATGIINFSRFDPSSGPCFSQNTTDPIRLSNCVFNTANNPCINGTGVGVLTLTSATFINNSIIAGTVTVTAASAFLPASFGSLSQVFTSNGPGVVPSFQDSSISGTPAIGALEYFANASGDAYLSPNWLKLDGSVLSQATYPTLFSRVGLINPGGSFWTARNSGSTSTILSLTYGLSTYVISGPAGFLETSTDAITWTSRTSGTSSNINAITFGNNLFVYGGGGGVIATSTNAITWVTGTYGTTAIINALTYGTVYVAGGISSSNLASSTDAITWVQRANPTILSVSSAIYSGSLYVVGTSGTGNIMTSTDGTTWITKTPGVTGPSFSSGTSLLYGDKFVGTLTAGNLVTSTDGNLWAGRFTTTTSSINSLSYGLSTYIAVGTGGVALSSTDAITWITRTSGTVSNISASTFGNSLFVYSGVGGVLRSSTDGITWTSRTSGTASNILSLTFGNGLYVYAGSGGVLSSSTDAITWTPRTSGTVSSLNALTFGNSIYVYGGNVALASSTDTITWTPRTSAFAVTQPIISLFYANGIYVASGNSGQLQTSTDAITWVSRLPINSNLSAIVGLSFNSGIYYAAGLNFVYTSTDSITWVKNTQLNSTTTVLSLTFGNSLYVSGFSGGVIETSTDTLTWTQRSSASIGNINGLTFANNKFVYVGSTSAIGSGIAASSTDGITWNPHVLPLSIQNGVNTGTVPPLLAVNNGGSLFFAGGNSSALYTSSTDYIYNTATQFQLPLDNQLNITQQNTSDFARSLYIRAL